MNEQSGDIRRRAEEAFCGWYEGRLQGTSPASSQWIAGQPVELRPDLELLNGRPKEWNHDGQVELELHLRGDRRRLILELLEKPQLAPPPGIPGLIRSRLPSGAKMAAHELPNGSTQPCGLICVKPPSVSTRRNLDGMRIAPRRVSRL